MDVLNQYGAVFGLSIAFLSAVFTFFNRERYKTLIKDIYQPGNDELRSQLSTAREEIKELDRDKTSYLVRSEEQEKRIKDLEKLNSRLPDFANLSRVMSDNHSEVINTLADLTKVIAQKGQRRAKK